MSAPIANSSNIVTLTLTDEGQRVLDATVSVTIYRPDKVTATLTNASVPHTGQGVYTLVLPTTAVPIPGHGYSALLSITRGSRELHPRYYFDVFEG